MSRHLLLVLILGVLATTAATQAPAERLIVACKGDAAIKIFDAGSGEPLFTVRVPGEPHVVVASADGAYAFTTDFTGRDNTVSIIDLASGTRAGSVNCKPKYRPHSLAVTRDGSRVYVTCEGSRAVVEIDVAARAVLRSFALRDDTVHNLHLSRDEKWIYASSQTVGTVSIVDIEKGELERTVLSGLGAEGLDSTPDGNELWVVNNVDQTVSVIDTKTRKRTHTLPVPGGPQQIAFTPDGSLALVSCASSDELALIDRAGRQETGRVKVGDFPLGIASSRDGARWYVANSLGNSVTVVDAATRKAVNAIPVGARPEGIAVVE